MLVIDGRHALARGETEAADHGTYEARVEVAAGRTTAVLGELAAANRSCP